MESVEFAGFFGDWLKQRRKSLDLTQEELAQRAACSVFALRKIESGERRPSKQLAHALAGALAVPQEERQRFVRVARGDSSIGQLSQPGKAVLGPGVPNSAAASTAPQLPLAPTPLLGRETELAAMTRILNEPGCRLLTLTGLGGIGKTRLALELATRQKLLFTGGVCYVELASLSAPELIVPAIADVLGLSFSGPSDLKEQLLRCLANQGQDPRLLVLDNLEHLLAPSGAGIESGAAGLVAEILQRLPNVKVLATSRERLNLQEEWTYEIHGLSTPSPDSPGMRHEYAAASLFLQAARRSQPDFALLPADQPALAQICQMLAGIPLAIELAAGWVRVLSCEEIAQEVSSNLDFLQTTLRNVPERHRSLRATFEHSWQLIPAEERQVLMRLAVFHGGFDRRAAARVAGASLPVLGSLAAKSLVRRREGGRYDLHEVIRQYALAHLADDPSHLETCDGHASYYLGFVKERETALKSASQQAAFRELVGELDNIRAAWQWAIQRGQDMLVEGALRGLVWMFETGGWLGEGIKHFDFLVQVLRTRPPSPGRARLLGQALAQQSLLLFRQGQFGLARARLQEALALLRPVDESRLLTDPLIYLGVIKHLDGEIDCAEALMKEALTCAQAAGSEWFAAYAVFNLGYIASLRGLYEEGRTGMGAGLALWRELGDPHSIVLGLNYLSPTLIKLGRYDEARAYLEESLALSASVGDRWGMGTAYRYLGLTYVAQGDYCAAKSCLNKSLEVFDGFVIGWDIARNLSYLGDAALGLDDAEGARRYYLQALHVAEEAKALPLSLDATVGLARLEARAGHVERALELARHVCSHSVSAPEASEQAARLCVALTGGDGRNDLPDTQKHASQPLT